MQRKGLVPLLAATLVLYGAPPTQTISGVLVYHAIAFWIPSIGGLWAYGRIRRQMTEASTVNPKRQLAPIQAAPLSRSQQRFF